MVKQKQQRVLMLCTGNSCRSQMAEGLVNTYLKNSWQAWSAGTQPSGYVHPLAIRAMSELGIDISDGRSKNAEELRDIPFDLVITVCDDASETCPIWLREGKVVHIGFYDPALATGTEAERMTFFGKCVMKSREQVLGYLSTQPHK